MKRHHLDVREEEVVLVLVDGEELTTREILGRTLCTTRISLPLVLRRLEQDYGLIRSRRVCGRQALDRKVWRLSEEWKVADRGSVR